MLNGGLFVELGRRFDALSLAYLAPAAGVEDVADHEGVADGEAGDARPSRGDDAGKLVARHQPSGWCPWRAPTRRSRMSTAATRSASSTRSASRPWSASPMLCRSTPSTSRTRPRASTTSTSGVGVLLLARRGRGEAGMSFAQIRGTSARAERTGPSRRGVRGSTSSPRERRYPLDPRGGWVVRDPIPGPLLARGSTSRCSRLGWTAHRWVASYSSARLGEGSVRVSHPVIRASVSNSSRSAG